MHTKSIWLTFSLLIYLFFTTNNEAFAAINAFNELITIDQINEKLSSLRQPESGIPDNENLLIRFLDKTEEEISAISSSIPSSSEMDGSKKRFESDKKDFISSLSAIKSFNCTAESSKFIDIMSLFFKSSEGMSRQYYYTIKYDEPTDLSAFQKIYDIWQSSRNGQNNDTDVCTQIVDLFKNPSFEKSVNHSMDALEARFQERTRKAAEIRDAATKLIDLLKARRSAIQEKISSKSPQQQISNQLLTIIIAIGAFSVAAIIVVRLFHKDIQAEWVGSGQVIQFVTVSILLSVIMALGLSNVLKENTLGTLLGGVAGYVLAQGVGRSAAREAVRGNTPMSLPPALPPPPGE